jgi:DNA-directed RNA polymerase subunit RPC12/RpoP
MGTTVSTEKPWFEDDNADPEMLRDKSVPPPFPIPPNNPPKPKTVPPLTWTSEGIIQEGKGNGLLEHGEPLPQSPATPELPKQNQSMITLVCLDCGKEFDVSPEQVGNQQPIFCSRCGKSRSVRSQVPPPLPPKRDDRDEDDSEPKRKRRSPFLGAIGSVVVVFIVVGILVWQLVKNGKVASPSPATTDGEQKGFAFKWPVFGKEEQKEPAKEEMKQEAKKSDSPKNAESPKKTATKPETKTEPKKVDEPKKPMTHEEFLVKVDEAIEKMEKDEPEKTGQETKRLNVVEQGNVASMKREVLSGGRDWFLALTEISRLGLRSLSRLLAAKRAREDKDFKTIIGIVWTPNGEFANAGNYLELMIRWTMSGSYEQDLVLRGILVVKQAGASAIPPGFRNSIIKMGLGSYLTR